MVVGVGVVSLGSTIEGVKLEGIDVEGELEGSEGWLDGEGVGKSSPRMNIKIECIVASRFRPYEVK